MAEVMYQLSCTKHTSLLWLWHMSLLCAGHSRAQVPPSRDMGVRDLCVSGVTEVAVETVSVTVETQWGSKLFILY